MFGQGTRLLYRISYGIALGIIFLISATLARLFLGYDLDLSLVWLALGASVLFALFPPKRREAAQQDVRWIGKLIGTTGLSSAETQEGEDAMARYRDMEEAFQREHPWLFATVVGISGGALLFLGAIAFGLAENYSQRLFGLLPLVIIFILLCGFLLPRIRQRQRK